MAYKYLHLQELRLRAGFTQAQLAERSGVSQGTISRLERTGQYPNATTLRVLVQALGCEWDDLINNRLRNKNPRKPGTKVGGVKK